MKASEVKLLDFLRKSPQFIIPIYQRTYSWTLAECQQLWDDILRTGSDDRINTHFVGSIVYIEQGLSQVSSQSPLLVIDGQQRLTTVSLLLEALSRQVPEGTEPVDGFSAKKLRNYYLLNPLEDGERAYKLLLTQTDKQTLLSLVEQKPPPVEESIRLSDNFEFFEEQIQGLKGELEPLCRGLAKLMVVDIALSRDQDNPQLIFESMNSTGRELSQADLIRNFILMGLEPKHQSRLYEDHWRPMEVAFGQEAYGQHFDGFMRHYLTVRTEEIPRVNDVYEAFKKHARSPEVAESGVDALVADIQTFASHYCAMALGREPDPVLAVAFADLRELKVDVAYPLLLDLYQDYTTQELPRDEFAQAVRWIESYVFRRAVCAIPTNSLNKTFANFRKSLDKNRYLESMQAQFLLLPSYRRFPGDDELRRELKQRDLYNFRSRSYWLRRLENARRKERVPVDEYTIEHIMPQNQDLPSEWREALGEDWERVHDTWLHTLGNLTLTGYNSEYSDHAFAKKRDMKGGFRESPLRLNEGLGQLDSWNEAEIQARAERLSRQAAEVWAAPTLPADVLQPYRPTKTAARVVGYSIEDHKHLAEGSPSRQLFDALRTQLLATDPCVSEEFLKLYVAYKAETNFVDIVPQAKRLRISLNLDFHELHDPRHLARDVTNLGRWGNGNVEVALESVDDIPYVMGLARQAFEKQMGNGEAGA
ncbi:MAG: DUF262 domain-containing protein [bacterium]|nr:DUF262 domain-containing protein [bacterium]